MLPHHVAGAGAHFAAYGLDMQASLVPYDAITPVAPGGEQALVFVVVRLNHNRGGIIQDGRGGVRDRVALLRVLHC